MQMPDSGEHAPVPQQEMPQPRREAEKPEKPQAPAGRASGRKDREVREEFPDSPRPDGSEPFVDNLDYAAIFKMFADPKEAERFEEVKPDAPDDDSTARLLDRAAAPNPGPEKPAEEKVPLFAEENPNFRDILREYMMGDQHPIYSDMPGIGKKTEPPAGKPDEREEPPVPRRRREYQVVEDFPETSANSREESPPETPAPAENREEPPETEAKPEKERGLAGVRSFLSNLSIRKTESGKRALNSPKAFARYEDYLPDEKTALQEAQAAEQAEAEARKKAEQEEPGEPEHRSESAGAHLSGDAEEEAEKTEERNDPEDDELTYAGDFPSFGQWILNELMGFWIKLNGVGDRQSTATMQDDREDLGSEVNVANASRYYGSQVTMLRMRMQIGLAVLAILAYLTLGFPVRGMLKTAKVAAGMCLALQLTVMLLCLDVVTNALVNLTRGRFGADVLAVIACLISSFDALSVASGAFGTPHIPLCLFSSLALMGILLADLLSARALRKSLRVPAIGKRAYCVTAEEGVRGGREITLLKSVRPTTGFVRRAEETPPDEMLFTKAAFIELLAVLVLSLLIGLVKHSMKDMLYILSAMLSCTVPVTALLAFALPFFIGSQRIFSSGAAVAGWSGIHDIGCSRNLIVTDRDLFPEETVAIETVRVFADESAERVISYAGTMIAASGSGLGPCFADLMEKNGCRMRTVEDFKWLSGGGLQGLIEGHSVLCGGSDLMQLMNVKVPYRLVDRTTVLLSIDGVLYGIFKINYTGLPEIRAALQELIASNRHPIFAIRDFIITPDMLHGVFDVSTDGYDFPPYGDRFRISEAKPSDLSQVSAVVCREGLGPLTHLADTGRSMYVAVRMNLILTALTAVLGTLLVFFRLIGPGVLNAWLPFVLMVLDAIFVMLISMFMRF
jgi:cation transport ATPase